MPSGFIVIPIAAMVIATIFSPINVLVDPSQPQSATNIIVNPNGSILFGNNATIAITLNGMVLQNQTTINCAPSAKSDPVGNWLTSLPILSSIYDTFASIGATLGGHTDLANACKQQAGNIITYRYDGRNIMLLFIDLIVVVAGGTALVAIVTKDSGGTYILFIVGALASIWVVLSLYAFPTFFTIPNPWGVTLYIIMTLGYSIGAIDIVGGGKVL